MAVSHEFHDRDGGHWEVTDQHFAVWRDKVTGETRHTIYEPILCEEIDRLAGVNARLTSALDAYHRFNNIGNDLKSAQWTVGEWAKGSDVSDQDLAYACKYLEDMA